MLAWLFTSILVGIPGFAITAALTGEWRWLVGTAVCYFLIRAGDMR